MITADFGLVLVSERHTNPDSRLTPLPFIRHHARKDTTFEPIFMLVGGPGKSNLWREMPEVFYARNDVVNVGYRGVDGEVKLKCPEIGSALARVFPLSESSLAELTTRLRHSCEQPRLAAVDLDGYTMPEVVEGQSLFDQLRHTGRLPLLPEVSPCRPVESLGVGRQP